MASNPFVQLQAGDHAPWFRQRCTSNPDFVFDTTAGRYLVLCFFGSAGTEMGQRRLAAVQAHAALFDDHHLAFFGVSVDAQDEAQGRVAERLPGIRHFWDQDWRISRLYGAAAARAEGEHGKAYRPLWVVLNPNLQVRAALPFAQDDSDCERLPALLRALPPVDRFAGMDLHAPVILVPDVFEPAFCQHLVAEYQRQGGELSGFMREVNGLTVGQHDARHKVRRDVLIDDPALQQQIQQRVLRHVVPLIRRAHHFEVTRMERYLVGCYDAADGAHFRPHRDNTTRGTAHRRFALSISLNDDFEGGTLCFPEFGPRRYKAPAGAAVVFSGALLHMVDPVRSGRRMAFLPFLYDEAAAAVRRENAAFLRPGAEPPALREDAPGA